MPIVARINSSSSISEIYNQLNNDDEYEVVAYSKNTIYVYFKDHKKEDFRDILVAAKTKLRWDYGSLSESIL